MAQLTLLVPLDIVNLDLSFPVGGTATTFGFELFSDTLWHIEVTLRGMDIATQFDLYFTDLLNPAGDLIIQQLSITDIDRPLVFPIGGTIQSLLSLVLVL